MTSYYPEKFIKLFVIFFILLCWQLAVLFFTDAQEGIFPSPLQVIDTLVDSSLNGELITHLLITLRRVLFSFTIAMLLGITIGLLMGRYHSVDVLLDSLLIIALNMPALVTIILCFILFGLNEYSAILATVLNKVPVVIVIIREGVKSINKELMQVAQVFQVSNWNKFRHVFIPQLYPYLLTAIRTGLSLIWKIVLVVELMGCSDGVGFQLGVFFQYFDMSSILAYTSAFIFVVLLIEFLVIRRLETGMLGWRND